jgi:SAM-dependent methyltransferase
LDSKILEAMEIKEDNQHSYNVKSVVNWYAGLTELTLVEKKVFEENQKIISDATLLDIGIGGGRTTHYLIGKCKNYIGVDYAQEFVAHGRQKFPSADIRLMDARDLSSFKDHTFDVVNFSFNGIDYVDLEGRMKVMKEVHRVLKPNGLFFFSTHNKDHHTFNKLPWTDSRNSWLTNLKTLLKLVFFLPKHYSMKSREVYKEGYAIINDSAHNFSLMTFYTSPVFLKTQLKEAGFTSIELLKKNGASGTDDLLDDWIFVLCKRSGL